MQNKVSVEEEYKKNPDLKREDILELLDWMKTQVHLPLFKEYEMIQGYHASYYNKELTKQATEIFFELRMEFVDVFSDMDIHSKELIQAHDTMTMVMSPNLTDEGYRVVFWKWHDTDPEKFHAAACLKYSLMFFGTMIFDLGTCPGYVLFLDFEGSKWGHLFRLQLRVCRVGVRFVQESLPVRVKFIEHYNFPINKPLAIMRPFIDKELLSKLKYRRILEEAYENVPPKVFPSDYPGGKAPSLEELREHWWKQMNERHQQFLDAEKGYKADFSKKPGGYNKKQSWFGAF